MYLNQASFLIKFQEILEDYYLKPLDGSGKLNLKDGCLERVLHGAYHASEAALWSLTMHNLLQRLTPTYVNDSLKTIASYINAEIEEVLLLILLTVGGHDTARKGEYRDLWEFESAAVVRKILQKLGLSEKHANLFAYAVLFKDCPNDYRRMLNEAGIAATDHNKFDYIRKLVNLGDNLDLMRCVGIFKAKYIFDTLQTIEGFDEHHHQFIMEVIKEIHQFIYEHHNMFFQCTVKDLHNNDVVTHRSHFSRKEKVNYEHAENVFAALYEDALTNPFFGPIIEGFSVPRTKKYEGEIMFNPFLHGTNSAIFAGLTKSNFTIMSPLEMMDEYQAVPMNGELTEGGYSIIGGAGIVEGNMGKTSFGIMSTDEGPYTLQNIITNYTNSPSKPNADDLKNFQNTLQSSFSQAFSNINLLLIYFVRARQKHNTLEEVIKSDEINNLRIQMAATAQFFYFIQLLGTYIHPDFEALEQTPKRKEVFRLISRFLTFENIVSRIIASNINMEEIVSNPNPENLKKALSVLEFAAEWMPRDRMVPQTQFFCLKPQYFTGTNDDSNNEMANYLFYQMSQNRFPGYMINDLLEQFLAGIQKRTLFIEMGKKAKQLLINFYERIRLFEKLVITPQVKFKPLSLGNYFLENKFPMILICENEDKIYVTNFSQEEYRSYSGLKLGHDIKMIATDTSNHRLVIIKFLELHNINNVQVILFDELLESKKTGKKPSAFHHHSDGVPKLKWLSAKSVTTFKDTPISPLAASLQFTFMAQKTILTVDGGIQSEENLTKVKHLFDEAQKYKAVRFN